MRLGRKLVYGMKGDVRNELKPCVDCTAVKDASLDTFSSDIDSYLLIFTFFSKDPKPNTCDDWMLAMKRVFDKGMPQAAGLIPVGWQMIDENEEPAFYDDGVYTCSVEVRAIYQYSALTPAVRGT